MLEKEPIIPSHGQNGHHPKSPQMINAGEGEKKREPSCTVVGMQFGATTTENSMEIP